MQLFNRLAELVLDSPILNKQEINIRAHQIFESYGQNHGEYALFFATVDYTRAHQYITGGNKSLSEMSLMLMMVNHVYRLCKFKCTHDNCSCDGLVVNSDVNWIDHFNQKYQEYQQSIQQFKKAIESKPEFKESIPFCVTGLQFFGEFDGVPLVGEDFYCAASWHHVLAAQSKLSNKHYRQLLKPNKSNKMHDMDVNVCSTGRFRGLTPIATAVFSNNHDYLKAAIIQKYPYFFTKMEFGDFAGMDPLTIALFMKRKPTAILMANYFVDIQRKHIFDVYSGTIAGLNIIEISVITGNEEVLEILLKAISSTKGPHNTDPEKFFQNLSNLADQYQSKACKKKIIPYLKTPLENQDAEQPKNSVAKTKTAKPKKIQSPQVKDHNPVVACVADSIPNDQQTVNKQIEQEIFSIHQELETTVLNMQNRKKQIKDETIIPTFTKLIEEVEQMIVVFTTECDSREALTWQMISEKKTAMQLTISELNRRSNMLYKQDAKQSAQPSQFDWRLYEKNLEGDDNNSVNQDDEDGDVNDKLPISAPGPVKSTSSVDYSQPYTIYRKENSKTQKQSKPQKRQADHLKPQLRSLLEGTTLSFSQLETVWNKLFNANNNLNVEDAHYHLLVSSAQGCMLEIFEAIRVYESLQYGRDIFAEPTMAAQLRNITKYCYAQFLYGEIDELRTLMQFVLYTVKPCVKSQLINQFYHRAKPGFSASEKLQHLKKQESTPTDIELIGARFCTAINFLKKITNEEKQPTEFVEMATCAKLNTLAQIGLMAKHLAELQNSTLPKGYSKQLMNYIPRDLLLNFSSDCSTQATTPFLNLISNNYPQLEKSGCKTLIKSLTGLDLILLCIEICNLKSHKVEDEWLRVNSKTSYLIQEMATKICQIHSEMNEFPFINLELIDNKLKGNAGVLRTILKESAFIPAFARQDQFYIELNQLLHALQTKPKMFCFQKINSLCANDCSAFTKFNNAYLYNPAAIEFVSRIKDFLLECREDAHLEPALAKNIH